MRENRQPWDGHRIWDFWLASMRLQPTQTCKSGFYNLNLLHFVRFGVFCQYHYLLLLPVWKTLVYMPLGPRSSLPTWTVFSLCWSQTKTRTLCVRLHSPLRFISFSVTQLITKLLYSVSNISFGTSNKSRLSHEATSAAKALKGDRSSSRCYSAPTFYVH